MINNNPNHVHSFDENGKMTCCSLEEKIDFKSGEPHMHSHDDEHDNHDHNHSSKDSWIQYIPSIISLTLLLSGILFEHVIKLDFFQGYYQLIWYIVAYLPVGLPVLTDAFKSIAKGVFFSEFFLMSIATIGAFFIGEYSEGVAVMVFYAIGELFQTAAVNRAKRSIKALLDIRPEIVAVIREEQAVNVSPSEVQMNEIIQVKPGEKVALDGELLSDIATLNTSALTGESKPEDIFKGDRVLAGMINQHSAVTIKVTALFKDSKLSKILELVQEATSKKAPTQLFISKFAAIYTPIVVFLAVGIAFIPAFFANNYIFSEWLYKALVFLVISCPCALVISIPLGYFGGIGLASRNGILVKGSNYLDVLTKVDTVVMDKTGTMTKGVFKVQEIVSVDFDKKELLKIAVALESHSTHPIARSIVEFSNELDLPRISTVVEIPGQGLKGNYKGKEILAGNLNLLRTNNVKYDSILEELVDTIVVLAIDNTYVGYITIADEIKEDSVQTIKDLKGLGIETVMLSGDKQSIVQKVSFALSIDRAFAELLPDQKVQKVQELKNQGRTIAFMGDGVNDAPVVALADVGVAMGGLGSDATIETADVVIQNDQPSKMVVAIKIGRITKRIVWQNILLALSVKVLVLILGAGGIATLWEAVFADVGVALLAILNAIRIQSTKV